MAQPRDLVDEVVIPSSGFSVIGRSGSCRTAIISWLIGHCHLGLEVSPLPGNLKSTICNLQCQGWTLVTRGFAACGFGRLLVEQRSG